MAEDAAKAADLFFQATKSGINAPCTPGSHVGRFGQQNISQNNSFHPGNFNMNSAPRYTAQYSQTNSPRPVGQSAAISGWQGQGYYRPNFGRGVASNQNQLHGTASVGQSANFGPRGQNQYFNKSVRPTYFCVNKVELMLHVTYMITV